MIFAGLPFDAVVLGAALLSGALGGVHCAAMCGGIATLMLGGGASRSPVASWWQALQANLGRLAGYALAGAVVGGVGHGLVAWVRAPGLALALRAGVGLVLIVIALRLLNPRTRFDPLARPAQALWQRLRPLQRRLLPADTALKRMGLGLLWGWLPCGLSATMLSAAWLQASALGGALTMTAFGLGTWLVMVPLTWSGARLGQRLQRGGLRAVAGGLVLGAGLLTVAAPWLMRAPALHQALAVLGCLPPQV